MCDSSSATKMVRSLMSAPKGLLMLTVDCRSNSKSTGTAIYSQQSTLHNRSLAQIKLKPERTALADLALHEDPPFVDGLHNVLHERQPQARPFGHAVVRLCPVELIEHNRQVLGWNPDACIGDAGNHLPPALVDLRDDCDLAAVGGVFHRVAPQVQHRL